MNKFAISFFLSFFVLFLGSCSKNGLTLKIGDQDILALGSVDSCNFVQSSGGLRVSWKSSTPVRFIIGPNVPTKYDETIVKAAATWNGYLRQGLISVHRDNSLTQPPADDRYNLIYWMTDWSEDQKEEQARTAIRWDISKLRDADIKINAKYFKYAAENETLTKGSVSLLSLMIHEMGHGVGLKHINDIVSVMQTHLASGVERAIPAKVDTDSLGCEY